MVNYRRAQSLLQRCMKTKADTRGKEMLISRLLMIGELQTLISAALISSFFTAVQLLDTLVQFLALVSALKTLTEKRKKMFLSMFLRCSRHTPMLALNASCWSEHLI